MIKLASNENPVGPSPNALEIITNSLTRLNRYPDAHAIELKNAIASSLSLTTEQLIITNGADELITLISETYLEPEDEVIVPSPSFSEYDFGANLMGFSSFICLILLIVGCNPENLKEVKRDTNLYFFIEMNVLLWLR